ncbi:hypothetical protein [Rhodoferax sp.]|uniref:hypothetical protein n=1 Tax=Rhodoferax sp. TaxID=50421 RepID=UPI0025FA89C4|nr:hypothetical protein [Rhodoferax sp.]
MPTSAPMPLVDGAGGAIQAPNSSNVRTAPNRGLLRQSAAHRTNSGLTTAARLVQGTGQHVQGVAHHRSAIPESTARAHQVEAHQPAPIKWQPTAGSNW